MVLLLKERTPVHCVHLSVRFHSGNSSSPWFSKGFHAAALEGGKAVRLVLLLSQGKRRKLTSEASVEGQGIAYKLQRLPQQNHIFVGLCKQEIGMDALSVFFKQLSLCCLKRAVWKLSQSSVWLASGTTC